MNKKYDRRNFVKLSTGVTIDDADLSGNSFPKGTSLKKPASDKPIRLGFIGIGGRGSYHLNVALGIEGVEVPAICELKPVRLHQAKRWVEAAGLPTPRLYDRGPEDYKRLCQEEDLDAVICCTPWQYHAPVCLAAMRNNKHCISEVPIILTLDQAWEIVETHESTGKWATIGLEDRGEHELSIQNMVQKGMFGEIVHIEYGYMHDLRLIKFDPEEEPWRLQHSLERNGNLYSDHPMVNVIPDFDINCGDRFEYLVSMSSSSVMLNNFAALNYGKDTYYATTKFALGDYNATLVRTVNGKMATLIHSTSTPQPREYFRLQGTKGVYLNDGDGTKRIYLEGVSPKENEWEPADKYLRENRSPIFDNYNPPPRRGGMTVIKDGGSSQTPMHWHRLIIALLENRLPDWNVYDSVTAAVISPLTELSVANKCKPVDFPDFTKGKWKTNPRWSTKY
jgi:hypothetical protein